ncbi:asparagine synthase (glutamine-hydrolyzing) [Alicyclobacillaceae bacterium I2511]|nr:asparagine synthase (glutamine-hydrolyzing) [Alicyclobacillaceae bacterium I2511]
MCGIAGWIDWQRDLTNERETVAAMGRPLVCRGPDAEGLWVSPSAAFAHRRLVVVDPQGGSQPMTRILGNRSYTLVYNGELYNTESVRQDLQDLGFHFQSYSDTEVVLVAYMAWGTACVEHFNGIFAIAIWDEANRQVFLARDRLGVKPLFYARRGSSFLFASELKSLLAHPSVEPIVDAQGLAEILAIGPARTPGTGIFKNVYELRAGYWLVATDQRVQTEVYWQLESHVHTDTLDETVAHVRELLIDTVERQLVSDVPVCTFLSGGLDSSAVTAIATHYYQQQGRSPLHTYSVEIADMEKYFEANSFQKSVDAPWARYLAESLGTKHHSVVVKMPDMIRNLMTPLRWRDVPGMADIDVSMYLFCKEVKLNHTVAVTGEAADEVFGGYPWFHHQDALAANTFPWSLQLARRLQVVAPAIREQLKLEEYVAQRYHEALAEVPRLRGENSHEARIREIGYLSLTRFLPTLLDRKDRMSMGASLEARVPFTDHRLVEYVFNVPWSMKSCDGEVKGLLRRAMKGWLPEDALYRKKSPYPGTPNPEYLQAVREQSLAMLEDAKSPIQPLIHVPGIRELVTASYQPHEHRPWFGQIMGTAQMFHYLLEVNQWLQEYQVQLDV